MTDVTTLDGIMIWVADVQATSDFYQRAFNLPTSQLDLDNGFATIGGTLTGARTLPEHDRDARRRQL